MDKTFWMQLVMFTLPALLVLAVVYTMLNKFFENENRRRFFELRVSNQRAALPIRLQAYERLTILLERLSVNHLILRVKKTGMNADELHTALLSEIRAEFDHNLSQQVYVSTEAWQMTVSAKEAIVKLINQSYGTIDDNSGGLELSKAIFDNSMRSEYPPTYKAILFLKNEAQEIF